MQLITGAHYLVVAAVRSQQRGEKLQQYLVRQGVSPKVATFVVAKVQDRCESSLFTRRRRTRLSTCFGVFLCVSTLLARLALLEEHSAALVPHFPTLEELRWRVDVTISTGSLTRAMRPAVLMQMALSDGDVKTFEVASDKFQLLRFNVAKALYEVRCVAVLFRTVVWFSVFRCCWRCFLTFCCGMQLQEIEKSKVLQLGK